MDKINLLNKIIKSADSIVFFGGAGVSTESGIPDFRSTNGLYNQKYKYPPEIILSHSFFINNTTEFYKFYFDKLVVTDVLPNMCHQKLVSLEKANKLKMVITQNIDGLHELAGTKNIVTLHGSIYDNYCMNCKKYYSLKDLEYNEIPKCECGGIIKPDVILYEESLDNNKMKKAIDAISKCDTLIIGGTSLNVYPAAGLIKYFNGENLIVINKQNLDNINATLVINEPIAEVFNKIEI